MAMVALPEKETLKVEKTRLQRENPKSLPVAIGVYKNAQIGLYVLKFEDQPQSSVFLYPSWYALTLEGIIRLDVRFSNPQRILYRVFKKTSVEDLDHAFVESAKRAGLFSIMSHPYPLHRPPVYEHSYAEGACVFLEDVIRDLNPGESMAFESEED